MIRRSAPTVRPGADRRASRRGLVAMSAVGLLGFAGLVLGPATGAAAHDSVLSSDPAEGSTVTTGLDSASITFSDVVLDLSGTGSSNVIEVTDGSGRHFEDGCSTAAGPVLTTGVALGAAGDYTMTYQAVSADGHTVSDSLAFRYEPPAGIAVAEGAAERPVCDPAATAEPTEGAVEAEPVPTGATSSTPGADETLAPVDGDTGGASADDGDGDTGLGLVIGLGVGIVVVALAAVAVVIATSRRRAVGDDAGPEGDPADGSGDDPRA
jgi:methionine-rich copper-binding protein CopC